MTRRQFFQTTIAVGLASRASRLGAAQYDLLIAGGRVIDPSQRLDRVADVAISGGRIALLRPNIAAVDAAQVIDARGKLVTPGLVDIHAHVDAVMLPAHCLSTGVTSLIDAGSRGADNVADLVSIARSAPNRVRIFVNLGRTGLGGRGELLDFANADVAAARAAIEAHRDVIIGVKARLSRTVVGERDLDAIARAHEITVPLKLPLMVHVGQTFSPMPAILARLRPGDIVTHMYAPPPNGILDAKGLVLPEVREARRRGIIFDIGNGRSGHITWDVAERALQQGFTPDTISSDLTAPGRIDRVFDFPTVLSKFLMLGMSVNQVIACATVNAARAIAPFRELGTLRVSAPADIAVFDLQSGSFEFVDNVKTKRTGTQKLVPFAVVAAGRLLMGSTKGLSAMTRATGTFEVKLTPQATDEGVEGIALARMTLDKVFHGDLEATSKGEMLTAGTSRVKNSAGYVAMERVTGTLQGRRGSFALQHNGVMTRGDGQLTISVVPDSGTDELVGLTGKMDINVAEGKHFYHFDYAFATP